MAQVPHQAASPIGQQPAHMISDTRKELTGSLLHSDLRRVVLGAIAGLAAGLVLLVITMIIAHPDGGRLWWLHLLGTLFYGGQALAFEAPSGVLVAGGAFHFFVAILLGAAVGKMTQTLSLGRLLFYGFVLGFLCWLASNMFGPDLFHVLGLDALGEWKRVAMFFPFAMSLTLFLGIGAKALKS